MGQPLRHPRRGAGAAEGARPADALGGCSGDLVPRALSALEEFSAAVDEHELVACALDAGALAASRDALATTGLLLVGEPHGVAQTPSVLYALVRASGARALALEWTQEEVGEAMARFVETGRLDLEALWTLPPQADFFAGDGRVTAGHFALLRRLRAEGRLEQLVLFDRPDPDPPPHWAARDRDLAQRLLAAWRRDTPLVAVTGAFHVRRKAPDGAPMAAHLAAAVPRLRTATIEYGGGACWFHGVRPLEAAPFRGDIAVAAGTADPAVVPAR